MNQVIVPDNPKIILSRSPKFPFVTLQECINTVESARKFGRRVNNIYLAGGRSVRSGSFIRKKAALGYFGLVHGKGSELTITDLAESVLYPKSAEEKEQAIKSSFLTPDIYKNLYASIEKNVEIPLNVISNLLIRQYGIQPQSIKGFLSVFVRSAVYANIVKYASKNKEAILFIQEKGETVPIVEKSEDLPVAKQENLVYDDKQTVTIALDNGLAKLYVPRDLTIRDAKKLKAQIDILANIFDE